MLLAAAILTLALAVLHSFLGGARLIRPLTRLEGFPVLMNSEARAKRTLRAGWHLLSITFVAMAGVMAVMHVKPEWASPAYLWMVAILFGGSGVASLSLSRGRHPAWPFFLAVAVLAVA